MSDSRFFKTEEHGDATALILQEPANADTLMFGDLRDQLFEMVENSKPTKLIDYSGELIKIAVLFKNIQKSSKIIKNRQKLSKIIKIYIF